MFLLWLTRMLCRHRMCLLYDPQSTLKMGDDLPDWRAFFKGKLWERLCGIEFLRVCVPLLSKHVLHDTDTQLSQFEREGDFASLYDLVYGLYTGKDNQGGCAEELYTLATEGLTKVAKDLAARLEALSQGAEGASLSLEVRVDRLIDAWHRFACFKRKVLLYLLLYVTLLA